MSNGLESAEFKHKCAETLAQVEDGIISFQEGVDQSSALFDELELAFAESRAAWTAQYRQLQDSDEVFRKRQERDAGGGGDKGPEPEPNANEVHDEQPAKTGGGETQEAVVLGVQTGRGTEDPVATDGVWHFRGISSLSSMDEYAKRTFKLQKSYADDISNVVRYIRVVDGAPALPESIWKTVCEGGYVNFAKLNGGRDAPLTMDESEHRVGDLVIRSQNQNRTVPVTNFLQWDWCYDQYQTAVGIAYPHRIDELAEYRKIIKGLFNAQLESAHTLVIDYDSTLRGMVGGNARFKLTDNQLHSICNNRFFSATGVKSSIKGSKGGLTTPQASSSSDEACRNWNRGECHRTNCRYRHICTGCAGSHTLDKCPQASSGSGGKVPRQRNAVRQTNAA
jgi:hypothetical protein